MGRKEDNSNHYQIASKPSGHTWFNDYYIDAKTLEDVKHNALRAELEKAVMTPEDIEAEARKKVRADKAEAIAAMKASDKAFKESQARNARARAELRAND